MSADHFTTGSPLASAEWAGLVWSMRIAPADDLPRLVAADWLQDTGVPELVAWAEFVRLQVEAARCVRGHVYTDSCDCGACRPERRAVALYDRWGVHWLAHTQPPVALDIPTPKVGEYDRGFLGAVRVDVPGYTVRGTPRPVAAWFARHPLRGVEARLIDVAGGPLATLRVADWVLDVEVKPSRNRHSALYVTSAIRLPEQRPIRVGVVHAARAVDAPYQLPKLIRATVRQVLSYRRECHKVEP